MDDACISGASLSMDCVVRMGARAIGGGPEVTRGRVYASKHGPFWQCFRSSYFVATPRIREECPSAGRVLNQSSMVFTKDEIEDFKSEVRRRSCSTESAPRIR